MVTKIMKNIYKTLKNQIKYLKAEVRFIKNKKDRPIGRSFVVYVDIFSYFQHFLNFSE